MKSFSRAEDNPIQCALHVLEDAFSIKAPSSYLEDIESYRGLISTWNEYASLISKQDLAASFPSHVADSISLLPYVDASLQAGSVYVDVGSGGGFPALPILLFRRAYSALLIERNQRKAAFLGKAVAAFAFRSTEVLAQSFPLRQPLPEPFVMTARAVEKPDAFLERLIPLMDTGSVFLRQAGLEPPTPPPELTLTAVTDTFDEMRLRRGRLYLLSRG